MKWFRHLSNSRNHPKIAKLRMKYGADGYAIYWYCLECVAEKLGENCSNEINFTLTHDSELIGFELKVDTLRVEEIMNYMVSINLFESNESNISCIKIAKYLDKKTTRNKNIHEIIDARVKLKSVGDSRGQSRNSHGTVTEQSRNNWGLPGLDKIRLDEIREEKEGLPKKNLLGRAASTTIQTLYNDTCIKLPKCKVMNELRIKAIAKIWKLDNEYQDFDFWKTFFKKVNCCDFLNGENDRGWKADFDFCTKEKNFIKILEGSYAHKNQQVEVDEYEH